MGTTTRCYSHGQALSEWPRTLLDCTDMYVADGDPPSRPLVVATRCSSVVCSPLWPPSLSLSLSVCDSRDSSIPIQHCVLLAPTGTHQISAGFFRLCFDPRQADSGSRLVLSGSCSGQKASLQIFLLRRPAPGWSPSARWFCGQRCAGLKVFSVPVQRQVLTDGRSLMCLFLWCVSVCGSCG